MSKVIPLEKFHAALYTYFERSAARNRGTPRGKIESDIRGLLGNLDDVCKAEYRQQEEVELSDPLIGSLSIDKRKKAA